MFLKFLNILIKLFFIMVFTISFLNLVIKGKVVGLLLFFFFTFFMLKMRFFFLKLNEKTFIILFLGLSFIIRLLFILFIKVPPESDFLTYFNLAYALSNGEILYEEYIALFPHVIGYPTILSFFFFLFGKSVFTAKILNVFASTLTSYFIYKIAKEIDIKTCRPALIFSAFCPSLIFANSLVATENFHLLFLSIAFFMYLKNKKTTMHYLFTGIFLALSNFIRPISTIFILSILIYEFLRFKMVLKRYINLGTLILSFFILSSLFNYYTESKIHIPPAKGGFGYNLYVGLNHENIGMWNEKDAKTLNLLSKKTSPQNVHNIFFKKSIERLLNINKTLPLLIKKQGVIWADEGYFVWWNKLPNLFFIISQSYYVSLILLCTLVFIFNKRNYNKYTLFNIVIILSFLFLTLLEAQGRYRFYLYLALCTISPSFFWQKIKSNNKKNFKKVL